MRPIWPRASWHLEFVLKHRCWHSWTQQVCFVLYTFICSVPSGMRRQHFVWACEIVTFYGKVKGSRCRTLLRNTHTQNPKSSVHFMSLLCHPPWTFPTRPYHKNDQTSGHGKTHVCSRVSILIRTPILTPSNPLLLDFSKLMACTFLNLPKTFVITSSGKYGGAQWMRALNWSWSADHTLNTYFSLTNNWPAARSPHPSHNKGTTRCSYLKAQKIAHYPSHNQEKCPAILQ